MTSDETEGNHEAKPPDAAPQPGRAKKRGKRILKILGILFLVLFMLVAALPTILSLLPLEGFISRRASAMMEGEVQIEGLSLGWFSALRVNRLELKGEEVEPFLLLQDFSVENGLWKNIFADDRLGEVRIASIDLNLRRDEVGALNYEQFVPPKTADPPPAEPFRLDLAELLPKVPLPISALDVRIDKYNMTFRDESSSPTLAIAVNDGSLDIKWKEGSGLLSVETEAILGGAQETIPFSFSLKWERWIEEDHINFDGSEIFLRSYFTDEGEEAFLASSASFSPSAIATESTMDFARLSRVSELFSPDIPDLAGTAALEFNLDTSGEFAELEAIIATRSVDYETTESLRQDVPDFDLVLSAALHKSTFFPQRLGVEGGTSFLSISVQESGSAENPMQQRDANFAFHLDFEEPTRLLSRVPALEGWVPIIRARFESAGTATYNIAALESAELAASLIAEEATIPKRIVFPEGVRPLYEAIDLRPLAFDASLAANNVGGGSTNLTFALTNNELFPTEGAGVLNFSPNVDVRFEGTLYLERISDYLRDHFIFIPDFRVFGRMDYAERIHYDGETFVDEGEVNFREFTVYSDVIPEGRYDDELGVRWTTETSLAGDVETTATATLSSLLAQTDVVVGFSAERQSLSVDSVVQQGTLQQGILASYLSPELMELTGAFALSLDVESDNASSYIFRTSFSQAEDFGLALPEYALRFSTTEFAAEGEVFLGEGITTLHIADGSFALEDYFVTTFAGDLEHTSDTMRFSFQPAGMVAHGPLLAGIGSYLTDNFDMAVEAEGDSEFGLSISGAVAMGESMTVIEEIVVEGSIGTNISTLGYEDLTQAATVEGLSDEWSLRFALSSMEPRHFTYEESHALGADRIAYADMAEVIGLRARTEFSVNEALEGRFALSESGADALVYQGEAIAVATPPVDLDLTAEFAGADVVSAEIKASSPDFMELGLQFGLDVPAEQLTLASTGSLNLGALEEMNTVGIFGEMLSYLRGKLAVEMDGTFHYSADPEIGLDFRPRKGRFAFTGNDISIGIPQTAEVDNLSANFSVEAREESVWWNGNAEPRHIEYWGTERTSLENIRAFTSGQISPEGRLSIYDATLALDEVGTHVSLRGNIDNIYDHLTKYSAADAQEPLEFYFTVPSQLFFEFTQNLNLMSPLLALPAQGGLEMFARLENIPGFHTDFEMDSTFDSLTYRHLDMFGIRDFRGRLPYAKRLSHRPGQVARLSPQRSDLYLAEMFMQNPPYSLRANNSRFSVTIRNNELQMNALSQNFAGGTADSTWRLRLEQADPVMEASFSITGMDGATMFPVLQQRPLSRRTLDAFGTMQMRLRPGATIDGAVDDTILRMEITRLGPDLLREMLRAMDREGGNPGIQSALTSLRFATPRRGQMDMRGGLVTMSVEMASAAGVNFQIPILDRANVSNLLEAYVDQGLNPMVEVTRRALVLLFADNLDAVREFLFQEEENE